MNFLDTTLHLAGVAVTALLFAVVAYFTRAAPRRIIGTLTAAAPLVPLVMFYDAFAAPHGWWRYPSVTTGSAPLAWYIAAALGYGAALGLVGWRVIRRWRARGLVIFLSLFALLGVTRDYAYSVTTDLIVFGPGPIPWLADLFAYASGGALVQLLMRLLVGPAQSDALRSSRAIPRAG